MMSYAGNEVDVVKLWSILWDGRRLAAGITALLALASLAYVLLATEWFRAEALLAPVEEKSRLALVIQSGGLASLAGIAQAEAEVLSQSPS